MKKIALTTLLGSLSLVACAQNNSAPAAPQAAATAPAAPAAQAPKVAAGSAEERAIAAIRKLSPQIHVEYVAAAPIAGFREVIVGGQTLYVSDDGKYVLQGSLFDIEQKKDLSAVAMANMRKELLSQVPAGERIVFAPAAPKYTVTVFTDVECGYCRKLHTDIAEYNKLGIAIEYLAFPRMGPASEDFRLMEAVWCSNDRNKALTDAKNGKSPQAVRCSNPVMAHWNLGQRVGLQGTPMIIAANGMAAPGYMAPAQLKQWLEMTMAAK